MTQPATPAGDASAKLSSRGLPLLPGVTGSARFSEDGRHRYELWRTRAPSPPYGYALFIGLNPSIGAPDIDDPTLRRMQAFAARFGYVNLCVGNAFSIRGTDPDVLQKVTDPTNVENDRTLTALHAGAGITIAAWGDGGRLYMRDHNLRRVLSQKPLFCLGYTQSGMPKHPLARGKSRIPDDAPLLPYPRGAP